MDSMSPNELMLFWKRYHKPTCKDAAELIGDMRTGYMNLTSRLAMLASNIATAKWCRTQGYIPSANVYEDFADRLFNQLPKDLRW